MICDHQVGLLSKPCGNSPNRAPRVVVPPRGGLSFLARPLRMFTVLHYCEQHKGDLKVTDLLSPQVKRDFEEAARRKWPLGVRCDFDLASIEYVLTTTPEYRKFENALRSSGQMMRLAMGAGRLAG